MIETRRAVTALSEGGRDHLRQPRGTQLAQEGFSRLAANDSRPADKRITRLIPRAEGEEESIDRRRAAGVDADVRSLRVDFAAQSW
ncbi:MAG: hypothetical protein WBX15_02130 [Thermoanaerobaculia bacterium]